jgi:hypothetical protein
MIRIKFLYFTVLIVGFLILIIPFLFVYPNSLFFVISLGIYIFVYKPIADYIYKEEKFLFE